MNIGSERRWRIKKRVNAVVEVSGEHGRIYSGAEKIWGTDKNIEGE